MFSFDAIAKDLAPLYVKLLTKRVWAYNSVNEREKAEADFMAAVRANPENGDGHSGLGYLRAIKKMRPEAQREAQLALLHAEGDYLVLHNVACIYSVLSDTTDEGQRQPHQDVAMALLQRAVKLWKQKGSGASEIDLIKG